jgi:hypothetical protein
MLKLLGGQYARVFFWTLLPGLAAVMAVVFLVKEKERKRVSSISFGQGVRGLPPLFGRFLLAVGLFGAGDCSHTLLILLATQALAPIYGAATAASAAHLLGLSYAIAALMALAIITLPAGLGTMAVIFVLGGIHVAMNETLEDSLSAELVEESRHGMAFGVLATVNGVGDFVSSAAVGALWSAFGVRVAFGYSLVLFLAGALLVWRLVRRAPGAPG